MFGEAPALQLSRNDRTAFTDQSQAAVTGILSGKSIPIEAAYREGDRLVLRFDTVDRQLKARDAIRAAAPRDYLVALSQVPRTPGWMRALGPEADEPRPRPARRRVLPVRGGRAGRGQAAAR